jgi:hypothetical protein
MIATQQRITHLHTPNLIDVEADFGTITIHREDNCEAGFRHRILLEDMQTTTPKR